MSTKRAISLLFSLAITAVLFWILLSQIEINDIFQTFSHIFLPALFGFFLISLFSAGLRAWRYKWLLSPHYVSTGQILLVTFIRNLFVDLLPARIGSLSYIYVLNKSLSFPLEVATSTFIVAFVFDLLTLSPFLILSILTVGIGLTPVSSSYLLIFALIFFLFVFLVIWKTPMLLQIVLKAYRSLLHFLNKEEKGWAKISLEKIHLTMKDLIQIQERKIYWQIFLLSLLIRLAKYLALYFLLYALLKNHNFSFENLSFWKMILGVTGAEMTDILPIKGMGGFGTWESGWALAFKLLNFDHRIAILSGIGVHLITNLFEYVLGITSILILTFPFIKKKSSDAK